MNLKKKILPLTMSVLLGAGAIGIANAAVPLETAKAINTETNYQVNEKKNDYMPNHAKQFKIEINESTLKRKANIETPKVATENNGGTAGNSRTTKVLEPNNQQSPNYDRKQISQQQNYPNQCLQHELCQYDESIQAGDLGYNSQEHNLEYCYKTFHYNVDNKQSSPKNIEFENQQANYKNISNHQMMKNHNNRRSSSWRHE